MILISVALIMSSIIVVAGISGVIDSLDEITKELKEIKKSLDKKK